MPEPHLQTADVVCLGENSLDFVARGQFGGANSKETLSSFDEHPGGQAATAAVAVARLGCRARYVGVFGDDEYGERVRKALAHEGVEVVAPVRPKTRSRIAVALVDDRTGDRRILEHRDPGLTWEPTEVPLDAIRASRVLIVDATDIDAAVSAARAARAAGLAVIIDVDRVTAAVEALLASASIIVVAEGFPEALTGLRDGSAALAALHARFAPAVSVVTLGERGSLARTSAGEIVTPAYRVTARDTTGAGDAFRAGLAAAIIRLPGASIDTLLQYANAAAALNCTGIGAQTNLPNWAQVEALVTGSALGQSN